MKLIKIYILFSIVIFKLLFGQNKDVSQHYSPVIIENARQFWITSKHALGEKFLVKIFLPKNYYASDTTKYPILYLTDGDVYFGAATEITYFLNFNNPSIIIVGIGYGSRDATWKKRGVDFRPYPDTNGNIGADYFLKFIREELIPKVESEYRVDSSNRTLFGWSSGGRFALYALFHKPKLFRNFLSFGAPMESPDEWVFKIEQEYFNKRKDLPANLWLGIGEFDSGYPSNKKIIQILQKRNYDDFKFHFETMKNMRHEYRTAVALLEISLRQIYFGKSIYSIILNTINDQGIDKAIAEYNKLKSTCPNDYDFREPHLNNIGYYLIANSRINEAIKILELNAQLYPESWNVYDSLGEAYIIGGNHVLAIQNYEKALSLSPASEHEYIKGQLKQLHKN